MAKSTVKKTAKSTQKVPAEKPTTAKRTRKKKTEEPEPMDDDNLSFQEEVPPKKTRTTRTRTKLNFAEPEEEAQDETFTTNTTTRSTRSTRQRSTRSNDTTATSIQSNMSVRSTRSNETRASIQNTTAASIQSNTTAASVQSNEEAADQTLTNESIAVKKPRKTKATKDEAATTKSARPTRAKKGKEPDDRYAKIIDSDDDEPARPSKKTKRNTKSKKDSSESKENEDRVINSTVNTTRSSTSSAASTSADQTAIDHAAGDSTSRPNPPDDQDEESSESNGYDVSIMRRIFVAAKFLQKQQKCVQSLYKLIKEIKFEEFYEEFCRNVKCALQYEQENPEVKNILEMVATFMISVKNENLLKNKMNENTFDEIGMELFGKDTFEVAAISKTYKNLLDYILSDALIPYLNSTRVNTRLNTLYLVRKILTHVVDIEFNIYERLKTILIDRTGDKNANVRLSAIYTIHRFQNVDDPQDKVIEAIRFHLKHDPTHSVRLACLKVVCATSAVVDDLISKTRDIKSKIREIAFQKIAKKVDLQELNDQQRLRLLNNGFKDRDPKVKQAVREFLVPAWMKCYDDDLIELLNDLDVVVNVEVISKFLEIAFQYAFSIKIDRQSKLHLLIDKFYDDYLDEQSLLNKRQLTPENCLFWRCLGAFLKRNEDEVLKCQPDLEKRLNLRKEINSLLEAIDDLEVNPGEQESSNEAADDEAPGNEAPGNEASGNEAPDNEEATGEASPASGETDRTALDDERPMNELEELHRANPVDLIMPSLSNFVAFFQNFCLDVNANQYEQEDLIELEFIFKELCLFLDNYDIADHSQKQLIINLAEQIILMDELGDKFDEYIEHLMRFLSKSVVPTNEELISYTVDITNKVEASLEQEDPEEELPIVDPKMIRKLELDFARESITYNEMKINLEHAVVKQEYNIAHDMKIQVDKIKTKMDSLKKEIDRMQNISIRQRPEPEIEIDIKDHPTVHVKLLQIFGSCLRYGQFRNLTAMMDTRITKYILPGILSTDPRTRYYALKALNHACFLSSSLAARFYPLYHEICMKDNVLLQNCALQGLIDSLVEHGLHILCPDDEPSTAQERPRNEPQSFLELQQAAQEDGGRRKSTATSMFGTTREFTKASSFLNRSEITTPNISMTEEDEEADGANQSQASDMLHHNTNNESDLDREDSDDEYAERQADLTMKSQIIDPNKTAQQLEREEEILKLLTKFLLKFIRSDEEEIKSTTVMGICKLLLLGRIYSPLLLSELILLWYNSSTTLPIQHDIGTFLPIYCLASATYNIEIPENFSGQHCLLECFMSTVENVYRLERGERLDVSFDMMRSNYYDSDIDVLNVIDFMLNLLEPTNHVKIVREFCGRLLEILQIARDDEYELKEPFATKYLIRSLESFKLFELEGEQREELKQMTASIRAEKRYTQLKKQVQAKIDKFAQKLEDS